MIIDNVCERNEIDLKIYKWLGREILNISQTFKSNGMSLDIETQSLVNNKERYVFLYLAFPVKNNVKILKAKLDNLLITEIEKYGMISHYFMYDDIKFELLGVKIKS